MEKTLWTNHKAEEFDWFHLPAAPNGRPLKPLHVPCSLRLHSLLYGQHYSPEKFPETYNEYH